MVPGWIPWGLGKPRKLQVRWVNTGSGLGEHPGTSPGGSFAVSDVTLWIPGHFGGSDGLWPLLRHGPAPPGSAAEPGMAHAKGWKPPALRVHVPGLPRAGSQSWASCVREGAALLQSPVPLGRICFPSASALPWLQARLVPSGLGVPPCAPGRSLCPRPAKAPLLLPVANGLSH